MPILSDLRPLPSLADSFRVEEQLAASGSPALRLWCHGAALVTGGRDRRLPGYGLAVETFSARGWEVFGRSSGGSLVVLDEGVLNVSVAWAGSDLPSLEQAFSKLHAVLRSGLLALGLDALSQGEVAGSICPGPGDLAREGRKLAGLSQQRRRQHVLAHAFLLVEGRAEHRLATARAFYQLAGLGDAIRPGTMETVSEALGRPVGTGEVAEALRLAALGHLPELLEVGPA